MSKPDMPLWNENWGHYGGGNGETGQNQDPTANPTPEINFLEDETGEPQNKPLTGQEQAQYSAPINPKDTKQYSSTRVVLDRSRNELTTATSYGLCDAIITVENFEQLKNAVQQQINAANVNIGQLNAEAHKTVDNQADADINKATNEFTEKIKTSCNQCPTFNPELIKTDKKHALNILNQSINQFIQESKASLKQYNDKLSNINKQRQQQHDVINSRTKESRRTENKSLQNIKINDIPLLVLLSSDYFGSGAKYRSGNIYLVDLLSQKATAKVEGKIKTFDLRHICVGDTRYGKSSVTSALQGNPKRLLSSVGRKLSPKGIYKSIFKPNLLGGDYDEFDADNDNYGEKPMLPML